MVGQIEIEAGIVADFLKAVAGMDAFEAKACAQAVEGEKTERRHQTDWTAAAKDMSRTRAGCAHKIDLLDEAPARMLGAEEHDPRHHEVEIGGTIGAGETRFRMGVVADDVEIDIAAAIDLHAREEEYVDPALSGAVEELAPAIGEEIVLGTLLQRNRHPIRRKALRQKCRRGRYRRGGPDGDVTRAGDEALDDGDEHFLRLDVERGLAHLMRRDARRHTDRDNGGSRPRSRRAPDIRGCAACPRDRDRRI